MTSSDKKDGKRPLAVRVFAVLLIFSAVIIAVMWLCQTTLLPGFYERVKLERAGDALSAVVSRLSEPSDTLAGSVENIAQYYDVNIAVYDEQLSKTAEATVVRRGALDKLRAAEIARLYKLALENGGSYTERWQITGPLKPSSPFTASEANADASSDSDENLFIVSIVTSDSGSRSAVILNTVLSPLNDTVDTLRIQLIYISIGLVLLSLALALLFSRSISRPIVKLNEAAGALAHGDYGARFEADSGCREIDMLADTLNYATDELSQVDRLRSELIANISHDLRTPLTMITGYAEMMRDIPGEAKSENLDIIISEAKRLNTLVADVMDLSRYRSNAEALDISEFSLTGLIKDIIGRFSKFTELEGYNISFEYDDDLSVDADEAMIQQVVYNLIGNSISYTGADKSVKVRQLREGEWARIEVADTGEGIAEDDLPHIFERYYRSSAAHVRPAVGTGLGLAIVKSALDAHGAQFGVITSKGQGSVFWFKLRLHGARE